MANNKTKVKFTEGLISGLLAKKHESDVYVPGCKNGPTHSAHQLLVMDAWVLRKTWSPPTTIGYEIKVDRNDFLNDQKWPQYLPYVHEFYFVCPPGLIKAVDLPKGIGLIWTTMNGERLITKIRAQRQQPDMEKRLLLMSYVMMARSVIVSDMHAAAAGVIDPEMARLERIRRTIEFADTRKDLANFVSRHLQERFDGMKHRCWEAEKSGNFAREISDRLEKLGIEWNPETNDWMETSRVINEINLLRKRVSNLTLGKMERTGQVLLEVAKEIRELHD